MPNKNRIVALCELHWPANIHNCSGFVKAVAADLGVILSGQANDIIDQIKQTGWSDAGSGVEAAHKAREGAFVVAGLKHNPHGHVAVVVPGETAYGKYPTGYWGRLGGQGKKNTTLNYAWGPVDRDEVIYRYVFV